MSKSTYSINRKVLVTGGSGYIGSVLVTKLIAKNYAVRVLDKTYPQNEILSLIKRRGEFILEDIESVPKLLFEGISSVIHLAAISNEPTADSNPKETRKINTIATVQLAKKAKKARVKRFIFASSSSIYDLGLGNENGPRDEKAEVTPSGIYSISKHEAEKGLLKLADTTFLVVILRKGTVCGYSPHMRYDLVVNAMAKNALKTGVIKVFCRGLQWRPLIDIEDVAEAYYKALIGDSDDVDGQIFNIVFDNYKVLDIAFLIQSTLKKHFSIKTKILFALDDRKDRSYRISNKRARRLLGFTPRVSIEQSVVKLVNHIKKSL